jgi:hypothetical protein
MKYVTNHSLRSVTLLFDPRDDKCQLPHDAERIKQQIRSEWSDGLRDERVHGHDRDSRTWRLRREQRVCMLSVDRSPIESADIRYHGDHCRD